MHVCFTPHENSWRQGQSKTAQETGCGARSLPLGISHDRSRTSDHSVTRWFRTLGLRQKWGVGNSGDHYYLFSPTQHVNRQGHKIDMAQQLLTTVAISLFAVTAISAADKSNIVFIFIDDWAWNGTPVAFDVAMTNSRMPVLQIPNLEKLSEEGTKSWNAYTSPQCSPSRNRNNRQRL